MTTADRLVRPGFGLETVALVWLISALAGVLASTIGVVGALVSFGQLGIPATLAGGVLAGAAVGRARPLVAAALAGAAPLVLIGLLVVPDGGFAYSGFFQVLFVAFGVGQGVIVGVGAAIGLAIGRRRRLRPLHTAKALAILMLAGVGAVAAWLLVAALL